MVIGSGERQDRARIATLLEWVCGALIVAAAIYYPYLGRLFAPVIHSPQFRDLGILFQISDRLVASGHYEIGIDYYPPSNAILIHLFSKLGPETAFRVHLVLQSTAFVLTLAAWGHLIGLTKRRDRLRIAFCACLASLFYLRFELEMHNINMLCLGLVSVALWCRNRPWVAGGAFALAMALKPYGAVLVLPWMLWHRQYRWSAACLVWSFLLLGLLPAIWFGPLDAARIYGDWFRSLAITNDPEWIKRFGANSLQGGIALLTGMNLGSSAAVWLMRAADLVWLLLLALFFAPALRRKVLPSGPIMAAELSAILIAPLPIGGVQQMSRAVVFVVAMMVCAAAIFDEKISSPARRGLAIITGVITVLPWCIPVTQVELVVMFAVCILSLTGLALARAHFQEVLSTPSKFAEVLADD